MEDLATKIIPLVQLLIPGFLTSMIFYWLADVPKPGQFERTIQALIGTGLITMLVSTIRSVVELIGEKYPFFGPWNASATNAWSIGLAVSLGLLLAYLSNHDLLYRAARKLKLTSRASNLEWLYSFKNRDGQWVVLTLRDGRSLYGYPEAWPNSPESGHFLIIHPQWLEGLSWTVPPLVESYLISNADVLAVEFRQHDEDTVVSAGISAELTSGDVTDSPSKRESMSAN